MKIRDGRVTILVTGEGARIEIIDSDASATFVRIEMNPEQFCAVLGGRSYCKCESMEVHGLDCVGKKMIHEKFEFELEGNPGWSIRKEVAKQIAQEKCPDGWKPDTYFGSHDSFFTRDGRPWARTTIRKWIELEEGKEG